MKHGGFIAVCLVLLACLTAVSVFGDENTVNFESIILDSFDGDSDYEWRQAASKFATKIYETDADGNVVRDSEGKEVVKDTFPKLTYAATWPQALFGGNREGKELKSLGIWGRFDRRGYNWIDVYPVAKDGGEDAPPVEIPIQGRAQYLDMWVWGSNLNYYIEAYIRDYQGVVHSLPMGNIGYTGWRNLRTLIPTNIPQAKRVLPRLASLTFVKFRVWTQPVEQVANFYIYFDHFKVLSDTFESLYDGNELTDPDRIEELWGAVSANN